MRARRNPLAASREPTTEEMWRKRLDDDERGERRARWLMIATWFVVVPALFIVATGGVG